MTTTISTIHNRITCVLADVAPQIITEELAVRVWELEESDLAIASALSEIDRQMKRMHEVHAAGQSLDFDLRILVSKQQALAELIADRNTDLQIITQMLGMLHKMTGTNPAVLRSAVFGSAS